MWDDDQNKPMMRNQVIAIVLMTVLLVVWMNFFMPKPGQPPEDSGQDTAPVDSASADASQGAASPAAAMPAFLPSLPETDDPAHDEVVLEDENSRLVFTAIGGRLKRAYVKLHMHGESEVQLVPVPLAPEDSDDPPPADTDTIYPFGLRFTRGDLGDEVDRRRFAVAEATDRSVTYELVLPGLARIRKTFTLGDAPYVLQVKVDYENLADKLAVVGKDQTPAYILNWGPNVESRDKKKGIRQALIWRKDGQNETFKTDKMKPKKTSVESIGFNYPGWLPIGFSYSEDEPEVERIAPFTSTVNDPEWYAVKSAYFIVAFRPDERAAFGWASGNKDRFRFGTAVPRFEVAPGAVQSNAWRVYIGPAQQTIMAQAWDTLPTAKRFFESVDIMDTFSKFLLRLLNGFYSVIPSYGLAIIFLTVLVRGAMFPLTIKQMRSMKKMQLLAPELEEIKAKYGDDQQELNKRMMELYRERGVNPLGGCLPMALQLPVFIALYRMLWSTFELRGAPFTILKFGDYHWIADLAEPDRLIHLAGFLPWITEVPFLGDYLKYLNILPILGAVSMVLSTKLTPTAGPVQNPQQKMMMTIMPIFFGFICYTFASGLNLYILTSTVLGIVQSKLVRPGEVSVSEKKPVRKKKQHFYTAAKERQRRMLKETKQAGKVKKPK
ncbi:MAG: YidC/Oxa1 family insertase periplasmic-domain containing protein [Candidatus Hydrogenedentes bacterium]|nr:YidC/Oxa1 family insertase periplasmic-domain containing protein [Candidatus Hydrogenedentota bacterium]